MEKQSSGFGTPKKEWSRVRLHPLSRPRDRMSKNPKRSFSMIRNREAVCKLERKNAR